MWGEDGLGDDLGAEIWSWAVEEEAMPLRRMRGSPPPRTQSLTLDSEAEYHGILVEEGLSDLSILNAVTILGRKRGADWSLLRVRLKGRMLPSVIGRLQASLKMENGVPFYAHFYRPGELIVVFPQRLFRMTPRKETWKEATDYGKSVRIPVEQLDFAPCRFEDETF